MWKKAKDAFDKAKSKVPPVKGQFIKAALTNKNVWIGAAVNAATTAFTYKKAGPKAAVLAAAGSALWSVASAALFESWKRQEAQEAEDSTKNPPAISSSKASKATPPKADDDAADKPETAKPRRKRGNNRKGPDASP